MVVLEQTEHSGSLFLPQAYREIKGWINRTAGNSALDFHSHPSPAARAGFKGVSLHNGSRCLVSLVLSGGSKVLLVAAPVRPRRQRRFPSRQRIPLKAQRRVFKFMGPLRFLLSCR